MKKILALLLALVMVIVCFAGCGKTEDTNDAIKTPDFTSATENNDEENENTNNEESESTEEASKLDWKTEELAIPDLPDTVVEEVPVSNTTTNVTIGTTPFSYDIAELKNVLENSEFITSKYYLGISNYERIKGDTYKEGNKVQYEIEDKVVGALKEDDYATREYFTDLEIILKRETKLYNNYNSITFSFDKLEISQNTQDELYKVMKGCVGEEMAKFLVYAKDDDGKTAYDSSLEDGCMGVTIKKDNVTYGLDRTIHQDDETVKDNRITFRIFVKDTNYSNRFTDFDGGYVSIYNKENIKYNVNTITPGITDFTPDTFDKFAQEYFTFGNGTYVRSILDYVHLEKTVMDDGRIVNRFDTEMAKGCSDIANLIAPDFAVDFTVVEKDGIITRIDVSYTGAPGPIGDGEDENESYKKLLAIQKEQINFLFPMLDISEIDATNPTSQNTKGTVEFLGQECTYNASTSIGHTFADTYSGEWNVQINYSAK